MRLTRKVDWQYDGKTLHYMASGSLDEDIKRGQKLGQLEDIEDELGIDLITLFKAIKQGHIYRKIYLKDEDIDTDRFEIIKEEFDLLNFEEGHNSAGVLHCACLSKTEEQGKYKQCYQYLNYISSYGKSWTLTEKELI